MFMRLTKVTRKNKIFLFIIYDIYNIKMMFNEILYTLTLRTSYPELEQKSTTINTFTLMFLEQIRLDIPGTCKCMFLKWHIIRDSIQFDRGRKCVVFVAVSVRKRFIK